MQTWTIGTHRATTIMVSLAWLAGSGDAGATGSILEGDARSACEAILCLSTGQRPDECRPPIEKLMKMKPWKRPGFLRKCPASNQVNVAALLGFGEPDPIGNHLTEIDTGAARAGGGRQVLQARAVSCSEAVGRMDQDPVIAQQLRSQARPATTAGLETPDGWLLKPSADLNHVEGVSYRGFANRAVHIPMAGGVLYHIGFGIAYEARLREYDGSGKLTLEGKWTWGTGYRADGSLATWDSQCHISPEDKAAFRPPHDLP